MPLFPLADFPGIKSVRLGTICDDMRHSKRATGFVLIEDGAPYLYTCWHFLAGQDPQEPNQTPHSPPREVVVQTKHVEFRKPNIVTIGGGVKRQFPLYDSGDNPLWLQQKQHTPSEAWNGRGVHVPAFFDVAKLRIDLPSEVLDQIALTSGDLEKKWKQPYPVGEDVLIGGYPYGFSVMEALDGEPEPVFIKRSIASQRSSPFRPMLLDGYGFPGMSGSPVYRYNKWKLFGIYIGTQFPDKSASPTSENNRLAAIGLVVPMGKFRELADPGASFEVWNPPDRSK